MELEGQSSVHKKVKRVLKELKKIAINDSKRYEEYVYDYEADLSKFIKPIMSKFGLTVEVDVDMVKVQIVKNAENEDNTMAYVCFLLCDENGFIKIPIQVGEPCKGDQDKAYRDVLVFARQYFYNLMFIFPVEKELEGEGHRRPNS